MCQQRQRSGTYRLPSDYGYILAYNIGSISKMTDFDIVIPVGPHDSEVIARQLEYTKKNVIGYRNIYLVAYDPALSIEGCITIPEMMFPFSKTLVETFHGKMDRNGWYLQQLLKLYAGLIIPDILERYLVIDCDTFFLKPTEFVKDGKCLYNYGTENHRPYFEHMARLDKRFTKQIADKSGICHHMMFETKYVKEIIHIVEANHMAPFYKVFISTVTDIPHSGASEYEIYFNYMVREHPDQITIRALSWQNTSQLDLTSNYDYISYHWYARR